MSAALSSLSLSSLSSWQSSCISFDRLNYQLLKSRVALLSGWWESTAGCSSLSSSSFPSLQLSFRIVFVIITIIIIYSPLPSWWYHCRPCNYTYFTICWLCLQPPELKQLSLGGQWLGTNAMANKWPPSGLPQCKRGLSPGSVKCVSSGRS